MDSAVVLRNLALLLPLVAVGSAVVVRSRLGSLAGRVPAAVLATLFAWSGLLTIESATDLWRFEDAPTTAWGMPLEVSLDGPCSGERCRSWPGGAPAGGGPASPGPICW